MKRVLTILAILLLPISVWAMTPVSDSDLSNVTGQAGVNINADLTMDILIGTMAWGDSDGLTTHKYNQAGVNYSDTTLNGGAATYAWASTAGNGGYVGMEDFNIQNLTIRARYDDTYNGFRPLGTYPTSAVGPFGGGTQPENRMKPITIDVATSSLYGTDVTFVRIGLGSIRIAMDDLDFTVGLATETGLYANNGDLDQELGMVHIGDFAMYISPYSYVDIYNDDSTTQGVNITLAVRIDHIDLEEVSWGDDDGLGTGIYSGTGSVGMWFGNNTSTGWVGLQHIVMGPITVAGTMRIDVATAANIDYSGTAAYGLYQGYTVVHIDFDSFRVNVGGPITANVNLGPTSDINSSIGGRVQTLGDIYLSGFDMTMSGWVDIWSH